MRINYMLNRLSEKKYRHLLQKHEKYTEKIRDLGQVRDMYVNVLGDTIRTLLENQDFGAYQQSVMNLKQYTNEAFVKLASRYKCIVLSV